MGRRGLTPKQRRFVEEYLVDLNATQAAIKAGCPPKTARSMACKWLTKPHIVSALQVARDKLSKRTEWTQARVIAQLAPIAEADIGDILDFSGDRLTMRAPSTISDAARKAIASVKVKRQVTGSDEDAHVVEIIEFKLHEKLTALDQITRHFGWYKPTKAETASIDLSRYDFNTAELDQLIAGDPPMVVIRAWEERKRREADHAA